jgi:hypothetical protein
MGARQNHFDFALNLHVLKKNPSFFYNDNPSMLSYRCIYDMTKLSSTMHNNAH